MADVTLCKWGCSSVDGCMGHCIAFDPANAAKASFAENHEVETKPRRRGSVKRSHRAEGRNWVD